MQATLQPNDCSDKAPQPNIKRYLVKETWKDYEVTLEVNHDQLTEDIATEINGFWSGAEDRLDTESGDIVRTVVRLFGQTMINMMLSEGGANFGINTKNRVTGEHPGPLWTRDLHDEEGWGGSQPGPYGWCGIRVVSAYVDAPGYDDVELAEVSNA